MDNPTFADPADVDALWIGRVAVAWNTAQSLVHLYFMTISGLPVVEAKAVFFALKGDTGQRDITHALLQEKFISHPDLLARTNRVFKRLGELSGERNAAIHTLWSRQHANGMLQPTPFAIHHGKLEVDNHRAQFERLTSQLYELVGEMSSLFSDMAKAGFSGHRPFRSTPPTQTPPQAAT